MRFFAKIFGLPARPTNPSDVATERDYARKLKELEEDEYLRGWERRNAQVQSAREFTHSASRKETSTY
jgi:hypothetical protein